MRRTMKSALAFLLVVTVVALLLPAALAADREASAEKRVIMCGRSVMNNWFTYWGWGGDDAHTVSKNGYVLQHGQWLEDTSQMVGIFTNICDSIPSGSNPVMFFKFCFVDFPDHDLAELQGIANQIIQTCQERNLRLIIGNALPVVTADNTPQLVNEHRSYNSWLKTRAGQVKNLWIYDMYGVLSNSAGALKPEFTDDPGDSHPNAAGYAALDATYFPFLAEVFKSSPTPGPTPPAPTVNRSWYFAEGSTNYGFEEYVCVQNPTSEDATVQATYMKSDGSGPTKGDPFILPSYSRATINVGDVTPASDVSVRVDSDKGVIAERSMYWNGRVEGHDSIGVMEPKTAWYLAEGCTNYGFEEFLCLQNPGTSDATVNITYNTSSGPVERPALTVPAESRETVKVNDDLAGQGPCDVSTTVRSDRPVVAERPMYWGNRRGGHDSIGTSEPANAWFLAEGSNGWGFETYVLVQNPGEAAASVNVTFLTTDGPVNMEQFEVGAGSRYTIDTRQVVGGKDFSTQVTADENIICERSMYWDNGTGKAGHDTIGVTAAAYNCFLAEGCTNYGFETFVLIANPNGEQNDVQVTFMTPDGAVPLGGITMPPDSRTTVNVNANLPPTDVSIQVTGELPIMAERAMYWNNRGGGHDSIGLMTD